MSRVTVGAVFARVLSSFGVASGSVAGQELSADVSNLSILRRGVEMPIHSLHLAAAAISNVRQSRLLAPKLIAESQVPAAWAANLPNQQMQSLLLTMPNV